MSKEASDNRYINRFSILLATLATFFAMQFVIPHETLNPRANLFGFILNVNLPESIPLLLGLLCAAGCVWLFGTHPDRAVFVQRSWVLIPNIVLPSLATIIASTMLVQLERNTLWWAGLGIALVIIGVIINAEYQVLSPGSEAYRVVAPLLISLAFGLFLALNVSLASSQLRMYVQVFLVFMAAAFVAFRTIHLRTNGLIKLSDVLLCCLLDAEIAGAMYYLFLKPIQFGLIVSGLLYILTAVVIIEEKITRKRLTEAAVMAAVLGILFVIVSLH